MREHKCHVCCVQAKTPNDGVHFFVRDGNICGKCRDTITRKVVHVLCVLRKLDGHYDGL